MTETYPDKSYEGRRRTRVRTRTRNFPLCSHTFRIRTRSPPHIRSHLFAEKYEVKLSYITMSIKFRHVQLQRNTVITIVIATQS